MSRVRSGVLAAWASAWLAGEAAYDDVVAHATGRDEPHRVVGLPGADGLPGEPGAEAPLGWALTVLRERSPDGVRVVLPVPGDPRGLPPGGPGAPAGSAAFAAAAMAAGEAVVGRGIGLAPTVTEHGSPLGSKTISVRWTLYPIGEPTPDPLTVAEAEHDLTEALRTAATALTALEVASWRPELAGELARVRRKPAAPDLPPGHDARAVRLLAQADRLSTVLDLAAADDPGGAVTSQDARDRSEALRPLITAVRRGRCAAYNAVPSRHR
ncbi:MAG TPA: hypothetical protein VMU51_10935 [Mycobacteriales bacterium]|nr:hypothetical protein [Mycobacteriales bacterium]